MTTLKFMEAIHIRKLSVNRGTSPTYVNSVGTIGVIFEITSPLFLTTKKYLVMSLDQPEEKEMNYCSGCLSPMVM